jgi:hypothetical protein
MIGPPDMGSILMVIETLNTQFSLNMMAHKGIGPMVNYLASNCLKTDTCGPQIICYTDPKTKYGHAFVFIPKHSKQVYIREPDSPFTLSEASRAIRPRTPQHAKKLWGAGTDLVEEAHIYLKNV